MVPEPDSTVLTAIGLMSGTSLDGVDAAIIRTDGEGAVQPGAGLTLPYSPELRDGLRGLLGRAPGREAAPIIAALSDHHADAVDRLLDREGLVAGDIDLIGFHGHTVLHAPERGETCQIGDAARLAARTGIAVAHDFRSADVAAGGEGAPLAPAFHRGMVAGLERPLAVLNLGGVANLTFMDAQDRLLAFDTGPGNALIDDLVRQSRGLAMDAGGVLAARGRVDQAALAALLAHPFFDRPPPKSLDRDAFGLAAVQALSENDAAATLTAFTAASVALARQHLPTMPQRWLVTGGGRHNPTLMRMLADRLAVPVEPVEALGFDGDLVEAHAFGYLAVRVRRGLPLSWPQTTGVPHPMPGGRVLAPQSNYRSN